MVLCDINITEPKLQNIKGDITLHHIDIMAMCCRVMTPFYFFFSFSCVIFICIVVLHAVRFFFYIIYWLALLLIMSLN